MEITRAKIDVDGIVQGVGFRPFVLRAARKYNLTGFVRNSPAGVEIEVEGRISCIEEFKSCLINNPPPLSEIVQIESAMLPIKGSKIFEIISSSQELANRTLISPDVAVCTDCLSELFDPANRRYLYPFINCTNCGPRLTIIENIPYDRKYTTMKNFNICKECEQEYNDVENRRFHAQPNACPVCGPHVWYENGFLRCNNYEAILKAAEDLISGKIVAVKGLGGFHLAVDAFNNNAVQRLRELKRREEKPLAVMIRNLNSFEEQVFISEEEREILNGYTRPILLLKKKNCLLAESIAPNNKRLGVMLAYTPLHHILFYEIEQLVDRKNIALVMTSANFSEEPIEITNEGAKERLGEVADSFIFHNRDILIRADDSVLIFINNKPRIMRRSRGYVPKHFLIKKCSTPIIGVGAELKNTICLSKENKAFLSQHIGDLTSYSAFKFFRESITYIQKIIDCKAAVVVHDLHPDYLSTRWAKEENSLPTIGVQHHHAHMASCMGEHKLENDVIGIILDGTGYGLDNTIWGGEILIGGYTKVKRYSYLEPIPLPGGDAAIKEPWRIALSYLYHAYGDDLPELEFMKETNVDLVLQMLKKKINSPLTSSAGRLFDAVSVICGGVKTIRYEAQAAIELMQKAERVNVELYKIDLTVSENFIPLKELIIKIVNDVQKGIPVSLISTKFHRTLAALFIHKVEDARKETGINDIVLSGGVFQNEILLEIMENELKALGFKVYSHSTIPTNDGGISFGQVMIAKEMIEK
jgi:hydrogenase maturation protein HypF